MSDDRLKTFLNMCVDEITTGGDYIVRIKDTPLYRRLDREYANLDDVIELAEGRVDTDEVMMNTIAETCREYYRSRLQLTQGFEILDGAETEAERINFILCTRYKDRYISFKRKHGEGVVLNMVAEAWKNVIPNEAAEEIFQAVYSLLYALSSDAEKEGVLKFRAEVKEPKMIEKFKYHYGDSMLTALALRVLRRRRKEDG